MIMLGGHGHSHAAAGGHAHAGHAHGDGDGGDCDHEGGEDASHHGEERERKHGDLNMHAAWLHAMGDMLGSVVVVAVGLVIEFAEGEWKYYADPFLTAVILCIITYAAVPLVRSCVHRYKTVTALPSLRPRPPNWAWAVGSAAKRTARLWKIIELENCWWGFFFVLRGRRCRYRCSKILVQGTPQGVDVKVISTEITECNDDIVDVHDVHLWELEPGNSVGSLHVVFGKSFDRDTFQAVASKIKRVFHRHGVHSVAIQPEFSSHECCRDSHGAAPPEFCEDEIACMLACEPGCVRVPTSSALLLASLRPVPSRFAVVHVDPALAPQHPRSPCHRHTVACHTHRWLCLYAYGYASGGSSCQ